MADLAGQHLLMGQRLVQLGLARPQALLDIPSLDGDAEQVRESLHEREIGLGEPSLCRTVHLKDTEGRAIALD